jgi:hypothetical protein
VGGQAVADDKSIGVWLVGEGLLGAFACFDSCDFRVAGSWGGNNPDLALEWVSSRAQYLCDGWTNDVRNKISQISSAIWQAESYPVVFAMACRIAASYVFDIYLAVQGGSRLVD